jgi:glycosyltransferase involved in cell wall biosynthesis
LRWHLRERALALQSGALGRYLGAAAVLAARAQLQRRDIGRAARLIAPSHCFAELIADDCCIPRERIRVVPNPVDLARFQPALRERRDGPVRLLFVSRISVRKGVEMIVGLSHRLADLRGRATMEVIGSHSLWSDYRPLLADLNPGVAHYRGGLSASELSRAYQASDGVLQPSHYEPFALTVGEALASGLPVVASDAVGASEGISEVCCDRFTAGSLDSFEASVRRLVDRIEHGPRGVIAATARAEATRLFDIDVVAPQIAEILADVQCTSRAARHGATSRSR